MDDLKPCPFCGAKAELSSRSVEGWETWVVECTWCEGSVGNTNLSSSKEEAIENWNMREGQEWQNTQKGSSGLDPSSRR